MGDVRGFEPYAALGGAREVYGGCWGVSYGVMMGQWEGGRVRVSEACRAGEEVCVGWRSG